MSDFLNVNKAILLQSSAQLIENLLTVLEELDVEIGPVEMQINGTAIGRMAPKQMAEELRKIGASFKPIVMETTRRDEE
jgi:hypothetical protein